MHRMKPENSSFFFTLPACLLPSQNQSQSTLLFSRRILVIAGICASAPARIHFTHWLDSLCGRY